MLLELRNVRQREEEGKRRWFFDDYFDLIVWYDNLDTIVGFQLCYDKNNQERALTWRKENYYTHTRIDDGEIIGGYKQTSILTADIGKKSDIIQRFLDSSNEIDFAIRDFILLKLQQWPG